MKFFLDTRNSAQTGEAILSLGDEPGGEVVAKLPWNPDEPKLTIRSRMFTLIPQAWEELEGVRNLWWYQGPADYECPNCKHKSQIPGASDAQIGRLERLRFKLLD